MSVGIDCETAPASSTPSRATSKIFGVLAVRAHDRWRREGRARWAPVAVIALGASLLSAEAGIATVAYLVAHALFLDAERGVRRLCALAPHLCVVVVWRAMSCALGYGAHGSGSTSIQAT